MPGIVGLITKLPRVQAEHELQQMVTALCHESFYVTGTWIDENLGVYVGWVARKGSFSEGMPLRNEQGNIVLIFSGEDFPEPSLKSSLKERGHAFAPEGPAYLPHVAEDDPKFPANLNGRFQGLLVDRTKGTATLFNDRYGMHRLCYHESKDAFYFAAEPKAILAVRPDLRSVDSKSLGEMISSGSVLENRTVFRGVNVVPPAAAWSFRDGSIENKSFYFQEKEWESQPALDSESYYQELRNVFAQNLPRYFNGTERIGMSLTGGLDTRAVMAWQRSSPGALPCYTYGGPLRDCRDVTVARQVAAVCKQPHEVIVAGDDFLSQFAHYAERSIYLSDACVDVSRSPDLYLSEKAAKIAPVRMTGLYGDEVLRHARAFKPVEPEPGLYRPELVSSVRQAEATYSGLLRENPLTFSVFRQEPWHLRGILGLEETQITARTPFLDNDFIRTVFRAPASAQANNDLRLRLIADGNPMLRKIPTDRGFGGSQGRLAGAVSRELLAFTFKAEYAYDYGMPQWVAQADHVVAPLHLERLFLGKHKIFHFRVWYRDVLSNYVQEMLLDSRALSRPYIERNKLETIVRDHVKGKRNYTNEIHQVLSLELLHRLFIDSK